MRHHFTILVFCGLVALCSGCEILYVSRITILPPPSEARVVGSGKDAAFINTVFEEYCAKQQFVYRDPKLGRSDAISVCGAAWFYSAGLYPINDNYMVELRLMQPRPWRTATKFFCERTTELYDFFSGRIDTYSITLDQNPGC